MRTQGFLLLSLAVALAFMSVNAEEEERKVQTTGTPSKRQDCFERNLQYKNKKDKKDDKSKKDKKDDKNKKDKKDDKNKKDKKGDKNKKDKKGKKSPANPYNIQFGTLTSGKALLTYYDPNGGTGKCGFPLPSLDPSQTPWVAIPLAYWPTNSFGNCNACNIGCSSSAVTLNGQPLCYMVTTSIAKFNVKVGDSCGGNCPPGAPGTGGQHPSCPLTAGSQDCANWVDQGGQQFAYGGVDLYRCPDAHECGPYTGFPAFGSPSVPCPAAGTFQPDFCSGKYMHIDLGVTAQGFTKVCSNGNNCVATYEQVAC